MKIRQSFVSNSSSSSFCLLCVELTEERKKVFKGNYAKNSLDHEYAISEYDDSEFVGMTPYSMQDDETLLQFKQRICDNLKSCGIEVDPSDLYWHTDGGYNG